MIFTLLFVAKCNKFWRRICLVGRGLYLFKDWPTWLGYRFGIFKKSGRGVFRLRNGVVFQVDFSAGGPGVFQEVWLMDLYEKHYRIKPGDVILDIGAHIGAFSVLAARKGAKVFAYEPTPRSFRLLLENIKDYDVSAFNLAVSSKAGEIKILRRPGGEEGNRPLELGSKSSEYFIASSTTLADIFRQNNIEYCNLLKLDCEGAETTILSAAPKELFQRIENISLEYHQNFDEVVKIIKSKGHKIVGSSGQKYGYLYSKKAKLVS